eukprot:s729_g5.t1
MFDGDFECDEELDSIQELLPSEPNQASHSSRDFWRGTRPASRCRLGWICVASCALLALALAGRDVGGATEVHASEAKRTAANIARGATGATYTPSQRAGRRKVLNFQNLQEISGCPAVCGESAQEFFWKGGPEPGFRSFLMDGGDADGCCDYTVDITFSVIEEPPSDLQVRIIDQFFDDPVFPETWLLDSSKLIQPVVPGGEEDIDCGITGGIGTVIETTITSTSKLDEEIVTTTTTTTTTTLDFQDFKWRENGGEANFSLDGLDASCGFCTYTVNITWTVVQTGSITEVNIDGTLFQPPEFPETWLLVKWTWRAQLTKTYSCYRLSQR